MRNGIRAWTVAVIALAAAAAGVLVGMSTTRTAGQALRPARIDGRPNFNGIWQALNEANWDLQAHEARPGAVTQPGWYPYEYTRVPAAPVLALGAAGGVPASVGVVDGDGEIPYTPEALAAKQQNAEHWIDRDPELKCYVPGVPRAMYMPYPYQIVQGTTKIQIAFSFANAARTIHLDEVDDPPADTAMGHSRGRWEGDTLVVTTVGFHGQSWFDRAGNFHSSALTLEERFTPLTPEAIHYQARIEDPNVFTRPWTISMPLYRRLEPNAQLLEYNCVEFVEEFMYGYARRNQLVKRWEGDNMIIEITRKIPPPERRSYAR